MRDKKNKIRFILDKGGVNYDIVVSDAYYKRINRGESAVALQNLKNENEIKYSDCGNDERLFFSFIENSFLAEVDEIDKKIGVIDSPIKQVQSITAKCRLYKEYCDRIVEQGLTQIDIEKNEGIEYWPNTEFKRSALMCVMSMYDKCQSAVLQSVCTDTYGRMSGLVDNACQMISASAMLAIGSADKRVINFLARENYDMASGVVKNNAKNLKGVNLDAVKEDFVSTIESEDGIDLEPQEIHIENLRPLSPQEKMHLNNMAERASIKSGMEVGGGRETEPTSSIRLAEATYFTPHNAVMVLKEELDKLNTPVR